VKTSKKNISSQAFFSCIQVNFHNEASKSYNSPFNERFPKSPKLKIQNGTISVAAEYRWRVILLVKLK